MQSTHGRIKESEETDAAVKKGLELIGNLSNVHREMIRDSLIENLGPRSVEGSIKSRDSLVASSELSSVSSLERKRIAAEELAAKCAQISFEKQALEIEHNIECNLESLN